MAPQAPSAFVRSVPSLKIVVTRTGSGEHQCRSETLHKAGGDHRRFISGKTCAERGEGEHDGAGDENAASTEEVGGRPPNNMNPP